MNFKKRITEKFQKLTEKNRGQFLAVLKLPLKAIEYFRTYLEARPFVVHTDHQALSFILNLKEPKGRLGRWQVFLMGFDLIINHRCGKEMEDADALSRLCLKDAPSPINALQKLAGRI